MPVRLWLPTRLISDCGAVANDTSLCRVKQQFQNLIWSNFRGADLRDGVFFALVVPPRSHREAPAASQRVDSRLADSPSRWRRRPNPVFPTAAPPATARCSRCGPCAEAAAAISIDGFCWPPGIVNWPGRCATHLASHQASGLAESAPLKNVRGAVWAAAQTLLMNRAAIRSEISACYKCTVWKHLKCKK